MREKLKLCKNGQWILEAMKAEKNPDKEDDAKLGEKVEAVVERHMMDNKAAEQKEGHKIVKEKKK